MAAETATFIEQDTRRLAVIHQHLNIVKLVGVIFILLSTCIIPPLVLVNTVCRERRARNSEISQPAPSADINQTACVFVKQFSLGVNTYITICNLQSEIIVDIRRFINGTSTIIGITIDLQQWLTLKQITPLVDRAIYEARTFWKSIKSYSGPLNDGAARDLSTGDIVNDFIARGKKQSNSEHT